MGKRYQDMKWSKPEVIMDEGALGMVDGNNYIGFVNATIGMKMAIRKARNFGIGMVGVRNSGHYGMASHYSMMATEEQMIGWSFTNSAPLMAPWGGKRAMVGLNPWSYSVPYKKDFPIVLDISNSVVAQGKILMASVKGTSIPLGWAMDKNGNQTTDPNVALDGLLCPLGEYKGYGISAIIDILCGVLTGSHYLNDVQLSSGPNPGTGHIFGAIDISRFGSINEFQARLEDFVYRLKHTQKQPNVEEILVPGELEYKVSLSRIKEGVPIPTKLKKNLDEYALKFSEQPLQPI